ncbi:MAG: alpha/beta fold hydrolase [Novosphingobium sp.]|nr:alpha/beta fold hydrolase [Novosphingobium sp.]
MWHAFSVEVEGATLSGERRGNGVPLVLVHGMGESRAGWDAVIAHLPEGLPVLRYDLRGFGASLSDEAVEYSHADDLLALLDTLGIPKAAICGLSMGGAITAGFAIAHPNRVEKAVLISPALAGWEWSDEWRDLWRSVAAAAKSGDLDHARELWWRHPMFDAARDNPEAAPLLRHEIDAFAGRQWINDPQRPVLPDVERLHELTAPALLLTGERDFNDFRLIGDLIEAAAPNVRRIDYADAGHMLPLERPLGVARAIKAFLDA